MKGLFDKILQIVTSRMRDSYDLLFFTKKYVFLFVSFSMY